MIWTVLSDNRTHDPRLETEHGLSVLLDTGHHRILLDTGASSLFLRNAQRLDIDLSSVDIVFVSHGHRDHAGGLADFLQMNSKARVIVSPYALMGKFYSNRQKMLPNGQPSKTTLHSITTRWPKIPADRLLSVEHNLVLSSGNHDSGDFQPRIPHLFIMTNFHHDHPMPKGNKYLLVENSEGELVPDDFRHELALYADGVLFTGCAHNGLENILASCPYPIHTIIGGFHLLDGHENDDELTDLAQRLKENYPSTHFFTSHCTGDHVFDVLKQILGDNLQHFV